MRDLVHAPVKQSVLIPDATHFVLFEKNRVQFFDAILKFLKEIDRARLAAATRLVSRDPSARSLSHLEIGLSAIGRLTIAVPPYEAIFLVLGANKGRPT